MVATIKVNGKDLYYDKNQETWKENKKCKMKRNKNKTYVRLQYEDETWVLADVYLEVKQERDILNDQLESLEKMVELKNKQIKLLLNKLSVYEYSK